METVLIFLFFQRHGPFSFEKIFLKNDCLYLGLVYQSCDLATTDLDAYVRGFGLHGFKGSVCTRDLGKL